MNNEKIIMLGTGHGFTLDLYNTCFILQNEDKNLLVDTGGGAEIIRRMEKAGLRLTDIHDVFFKAYEKNHSTVKSVCKEMNNFNIKNLILYHTEDTHPNKKELYTNEAKQYFENNVIVPIDMEEIIL